MMSIVPTRRPWYTTGRLAATIALLAVCSSALLLLSGLEAPAMACLAGAQ